MALFKKGHSEIKNAPQKMPLSTNWPYNLYILLRISYIAGSQILPVLCDGKKHSGPSDYSEARHPREEDPLRNAYRLERRGIEIKKIGEKSCTKKVNRN